MPQKPLLTTYLPTYLFNSHQAAPLSSQKKRVIHTSRLCLGWGHGNTWNTKTRWKSVWHANSFLWPPGWVGRGSFVNLATHAAKLLAQLEEVSISKLICAWHNSVTRPCWKAICWNHSHAGNPVFTNWEILHKDLDWFPLVMLFQDEIWQQSHCR